MTTTQQSCTRLATAALFGLLIAVPVVILCRLAAFTPQAEDFHTSLTNWLIVWACLTLFLGLNASTVMDFLLRRGLLSTAKQWSCPSWDLPILASPSSPYCSRFRIRNGSSTNHKKAIVVNRYERLNKVSHLNPALDGTHVPCRENPHLTITNGI
jgi:hypothetical protein